MARGPDGKGGGAGASLADQLFNAQSLSDLAGEYAVLPGFDRDRFVQATLPGLEGRGLLQRLDWIADNIAAQLPSEFPAMAEALTAAMPPPLDPTRTDDDFGRFIHAVPGILAARHGMETPDRALDLLHAATQRFSMEFYIRPYLNRWPDLTLARLQIWCEDPNYHVRRLVSEGTRPRLPWAKNIHLAPETALPLLDRLYADPTRYVTRSVANHLNDLTKPMPDAVLERLRDWTASGQQAAKEMDWITRHALRTAVKRGHKGALAHLGYVPGGITADLQILGETRINDALSFTATLQGPPDTPMMVDYRLTFHRPSGPADKVFKLKTARLDGAGRLSLTKTHKLKGDATTFRLYPGDHALTLQVNGQDLARASFPLLAPKA